MPLSATQSSIFAFSADKSKILRMFAKFVRLAGTGKSQFRPVAIDSYSILSVENQAGALRAGRFAARSGLGASGSSVCIWLDRWCL